MKKLLFILIALMTVSTVIFASFPVTENSTVLVDSNNQPIEAPSPDIDWGVSCCLLFCWCFGNS